MRVEDRWRAVLVAVVSAALVIGTVSFAYLFRPQSALPETPASFIFFNGPVVTVDPVMAQAEALAVRDERILSVGSDAIVHATRSPGTTVVDLDGRALLPGFIDGHVHLLLHSEGRAGKTLSEAVDVALRYGVTTVSEMVVDEPLLEKLFRAEREGSLRLRVNAYVVYNDGSPDTKGIRSS